MVPEIEKFVIETCKKESNLDGFGAWTHHISVVRDNAVILAKKLNADPEIVEIAALLHDIGSVTSREWQQDHHVHGARIAKEILEKYKYPKDRLDQILHCIIAHRGSKDIPRKTLEAEIVASADAMAHIINVKSLLNYAYSVKGMGIDEGAEWVSAKIERSWKKLMPEAKEMVRSQYEAAKVVLGT